ncbi:MAG: beta-ketoacyl synthase N-terminal-like domain-containing protein, partial [Alphaproteobacteria bacterium]
MSKYTDHLGRPLVAITGLGVVSSLGQGRQENWNALTSGTSGIHTISRFALDNLRTQIAGTVDFLEESSQGASALSQKLASLAAEEAIAQAGFPLDDFGGPLFLAAPPVELEWRNRFALDALVRAEGEPGYDLLLAACRRAPQTAMFNTAEFGFIAERLADTFGTRGLPITLSTACASGATAIQLGVEAIRRGES